MVYKSKQVHVITFLQMQYNILTLRIVSLWEVFDRYSAKSRTACNSEEADVRISSSTTPNFRWAIYAR